MADDVPVIVHHRSGDNCSAELLRAAVARLLGVGFAERDGRRVDDGAGAPRLLVHGVGTAVVGQLRRLAAQDLGVGLLSDRVEVALVVKN